MLLVVDVGNTHTVAGLYAPDAAPAADPAARWRWRTEPAGTVDELAARVAQLLALDGHSAGGVERIAVSSVVPTLTAAWRGVAARIGAADPVFVVGGDDLPLHGPDGASLNGLGADRVADSVAAWHRYGGPCIVVDLGTATTYDVVADDATWVGGAIAPGIGVSFGALVERAALLSSVELRLPPRAIGHDTETHVQSGTMLGAVAQVEGMLARIRAELVRDHGVAGDRHVPAIATGGFAALLLDAVAGLDDVDPDLTLRGIHLLALRHDR